MRLLEVLTNQIQRAVQGAIRDERRAAAEGFIGRTTYWFNRVQQGMLDVAADGSRAVGRGAAAAAGHAAEHLSGGVVSSGAV